jgi:hypothetical protein
MTLATTPAHSNSDHLASQMSIGLLLVYITSKHTASVVPSSSTWHAHAAPVRFGRECHELYATKSYHFVLSILICTLPFTVLCCTPESHLASNTMQYTVPYAELASDVTRTGSSLAGTPFSSKASKI